MCLNKQAEIGKTRYSESELYNVASKYTCLAFYLFLKFYSFIYIYSYYGPLPVNNGCIRVLVRLPQLENPCFQREKPSIMLQCKSTESKINYVGSSSWKVEEWKFITFNIKELLVGGREVVQLVEAMHHMSERSVFDSR